VPLLVSIPKVDSIAWNKITGNAPKIIEIIIKAAFLDSGVSEKQMEVMKRLFDI